jgi:hypothetical protein
VMRSCTVVVPLFPMETVSLKSATLQLRAYTGEHKASREAAIRKRVSPQRRSLLRLCVQRFRRDVVSDVSTGVGPAVNGSASELHRHRFTVGGIADFKELPQLEAKHPRDDVRGERLNLGIQIAHHRVVVAARVLNRIFGLVE